VSQALRSGFNRIIGQFDGGQATALATNSRLAGFDQAQFDLDMAAAQPSGQPVYSCAQACQDGSSLCPNGGCVLPNAEAAQAPTDTLSWMKVPLKDVSKVILARSVISSELYAKPVCLNGAMLTYKDGAFEPMALDIMAAKVLPHLGITQSLPRATEIVGLMRAVHTRHVDFFDPSPNHICFKNGTLDVAARQMVPHSPAYQLQNRIDHDYDPAATCPAFMEFLNQIWRDDADRDAKIRLMAQWAGYLLVADPRMQKMMILLGSGANGKSVLMDVVKTMIGERNTANAMLNRLRMPYVRATLDRKLLNLSPDLPKTGVVSDGDLKAIVGGDPIEVSPKRVHSYSIHPYVRLMAATNNLPASKDTSDGYFRRMLIVSFNRQFSEAERNPNLLASLLAEMPGIVAWAVRGLYDLRELGAFSTPASSAKAVEEYKETISPATLFARECLVASSHPGILPVELFEQFCIWCRDRRLSPGNMIVFGRELAQLGFIQRKSGHTWWQVTLIDRELLDQQSRPLPGILAALPPSGSVEHFHAPAPELMQ
jgi:putative DNA primase/helicase